MPAHVRPSLHARTVIALLLALAALLSGSAAAAADTAARTEVERSPLCAFLDAGLANAYTSVSATATLSLSGVWGELYGGETITFTPGSVADPDDVVLTIAVRTSGQGGDSFDTVATSATGATTIAWTAPRMPLSALRTTVSTGNYHTRILTCDARPAGPATDIDELRALLGDLDLHGGIAQGLDSKLANAWTAAWNSDPAACRHLDDFRDLVAAQDGKKLGAIDAARLADAAAQILADLRC